MSETEKVLLVERQGPIAIVTLNRPDKRNALSEKLWGELKATFENFEPDVRCVVLAGAGKHFCAGLDLSEHRHREAFDSIFMSRFAHAADIRISSFRKVVSRSGHGLSFVFVPARPNRLEP